MLEVGNGTLTVSESRAHFSLWCMLAAPLIAGNDLRTMSKTTLEILTNKEAVAIDQDSLGIQGFRQTNADSLEIWYKPLKGGIGRSALSTGDRKRQPSDTIGRKMSFAMTSPNAN